MATHSQQQKFCEHCGSYLEQYYSPKTAAQICDLSEQFFRNLIRDRKIKSVKFGRSVRIPASEIQKLMLEVPTIDEMYG